MTDVQSQAGTAFRWSFANTAISRLGTMLIGVALARLLGPDQFGTFAVAWVAVVATLSLNDLGVSLAIVRWPEEPRRLAPTVNTVTVASSAVLATIMVSLSGPFATSMGESSAAPLVRWLAVCVIIDGLVATPAAILQRTFRQDRRMVADQVNVWVGAGVSITLAVSGVGAESLVAGRICGSLLSAMLLLRFSPIPYRFGLDSTLGLRLLRFGMPLAGASALAFGIGFVDQLVVGRELGPRELAFYVLAFNLASWPVSIISGPLRSVAAPLFAHLRSDPHARASAFRSVLRPLGIVTLPACVGIAAAAPAVVAVVYGTPWAGAAGPLRWLALFAALRIFFELAYDYVVVAGRSMSLLTVQIIWFSALVPAVLVGVHLVQGAGVAFASFMVGLVVVAPCYVVLLRRIDIDVRRAGVSLVIPLIASMVLWAGITVILATGWTDLVTLITAGALSALTIGVLLIVYRADLSIWHADSAPEVTS